MRLLRLRLLFPLSRLRERAGVRASLQQRLKDAFQHRTRLLQDLMIPESHHSKSSARQIECALVIFQSTIGVLTSVELDHETRAQTDEIHDVAAEWHLPPESIATKAAIAQEAPKTSFRIA
jgi:hypothetical protein